METKASSWIENVSQEFQSKLDSYTEKGGSLADPEAIEYLKNQNQSEEVIKAELRKKGLPFLAVMPKHFFHSLVKKASSLYTFSTITSDCKVKVDRFGSSIPYLRVTNLLNSYWMAYLFLIFLPGGALLKFKLETQLQTSTSLFELLVYFSILVIGFARVFLMMRLNNGFSNTSFLNKLELFICVGISFDAILIACWKFGKKQVKDTLFRRLDPHILWPQKTDIHYQSLQEDIQINFSLFTDPIINDLKVLGEDYSPYIVADENSICISEEEKNTFISKVLDPLVCADVGDHTIIFSQYGEFPSEKEMVEYVESYLSSITKKELFSKN